MTLDTPADAEARVEALLRRRSGSDRIVMACEMFDCARALVEARIRASRPDVTDSELRVGVLHRLYGDELSAARLARIGARLALIDTTRTR